MDTQSLEKLLDNEREWRKYIVNQLEDVSKVLDRQDNEIAAMKVWNIVFRTIGAAAWGSVVAILLIVFEHTINK